MKAKSNYKNTLELCEEKLMKIFKNKNVSKNVYGPIVFDHDKIVSKSWYMSGLLVCKTSKTVVGI